MRALTRHRYGEHAARLEEVPRPVATPGHVLVRVHAAGIGREVLHVMTGTPLLMRLAGFGVTKPKQPILGRDLAGIVEEVGPGVTSVEVGDAVFGTTDGSFADVAQVNASDLAPLPAGLSFAEAAAMPVSGIAALEAARDHGRIGTGQRVAVTGASGGVGSFAVQIAAALGAEVTGVASGAKAGFVRSLGARHFVDYTTADFTRGGTRYDVILDIGGNRRLSELRRTLSPTGRLVIVGGEGGDILTGGTHRQLRAVALSPFVKQTLTSFISKERQRDLEQLAGLVETGQLRPALDRWWRPEEVLEALRYLEEGRGCGKSVFVFDPSNRLS